MPARTMGSAAVAALVAVLLAAAPAHGQRERFEATVGADYDQGKFGTGSTTRTLVMPFGLKYLGDKFDASITASVDRIDSEDNVVLINETPAGTQVSTQRQRRVSSLP